MRYLYEVCYTMDLGFNEDLWRIHGVRDGEPVFISTPVKFEDGVITTTSGSKYKIGSYNTDPHEFEKQIKKDIERGHFFRH